MEGECASLATVQPRLRTVPMPVDLHARQTIHSRGHFVTGA